MRILLSSEHRYPAFADVGTGPHPKPYPSGSGFWIHDLLARGLAALGHEVFYLLRQGAAKPLPPGVQPVPRPVWDADILHTISDRDDALIDEWQSRGRPWVSTCHIDMRTRGLAQRPTTENWIFVSRTLAHRHGRQRFVLNGVDPDACIYSESKRDYFLFMSSMDWEMKKGLDIAISLSFRMRAKLVVAGTANNYKRIMRISGLCRQIGATYVGDVRGKRKAELLAGARAFIFPTRVDEAFGLGMVEALMSGTPVICSNRGACPEIITPEVGFVCQTDDDYLTAIDRVTDIDPRVCRDKAMRDYHYHTMARNYVRQYEIESARITRELALPATHH